MLAIERSKTHKGKCTPNVLPCRVHHNGPVNASKRYWDPRTSDEKTVSYFRGRKLHGKKLKVPKGFRGVVFSSTDRVLPKPQSTDAAEDEEDVDETPKVKIIEEQSEFDEMVVWGHEALPDEMADPYLRGMEEWIAFADTIHSNDDDANDGATKKN